MNKWGDLFSMARRMIDTDFWNRPEVRSLKPAYKLLWAYLNCACDHAGIWTVELDVAALRLGVKLDEAEALSQLGNLVEAHGGKWVLPTFVRDQYGELNPSNKVHASVIQRLEAVKNEATSKPLPSPLVGAKDMDKEKDKDREGVQGEPKQELVWPSWAGEKCKSKWAEFIAYRIREKKARYKSIETEQKALDLACRYFSNGPHFVEGLEHTMAKTWQFPVDPAEHKYPFGQSAPGKRTQEELLAKWDVLRCRPGGAGPEDIYDDKELLELIYPGKYTR